MEKPYSSSSFEPIYSSSSSRSRNYQQQHHLFSDEDAVPHHFLDSCFLCKKPLGGRDIFMYRGNIPFCSEECRQEQIEIDESLEKKSSSKKSGGTKSSSAKSEKINVRSATGVSAGVVTG